MQDTGIRQALSALAETCHTWGFSAAQTQIITTREEQEVEIVVDAFWWISKQCMGENWTFYWKCPGVGRVLTAPGASWEQWFIFQPKQAEGASSWVMGTWKSHQVFTNALHQMRKFTLNTDLGGVKPDTEPRGLFLQRHKVWVYHFCC